MSEDESEDVVQKLDRSIDFWAQDRDDYPPAIRGVIAELDDFKGELRDAIIRLGTADGDVDSVLQRVLWFDDKNEKLDQACSASKQVFLPYVSDEFGLISWKDKDNPVMDLPTRHRLLVSDEFASNNYSQPRAGELILDDSLTGISGPPARKVPEWSWKRKISQTLKPWRIKDDDVIKAARKPDDLMRTLNALMSVTKHGWLVVDLVKLKKQRGSVLVYARTYEYQAKGDQRFQFLVQLIGTAHEYRRRLDRQLANVACLYLESNSRGDVFVTKISVFEDKAAADVVLIPIPARVINQSGQPSQIVLDESGKYFQSKIKPLLASELDQVKKLDIRKASKRDTQYRFRLKLKMEGPLLVATSGNAMIFKFDDLLYRFRNTSIAKEASNEPQCPWQVAICRRKVKHL